MTRSSGDAPTAVTEDSATSAQAAPMAEAPANPTTAQVQEAGGEVAATPPQDARDVAREDAQWRQDHPDEVRTRAGVEGVGGESFEYLRAVDQPVATTEDEKEAAEKASRFAQDDEQWRQEHPGKVRARNAREGAGGESFAYLDVVDQGAHPDNVVFDDGKPDDEPEGEPDDSWKKAQIEAYASRNGIDLAGASTKADMLEAIQKAK